VAIPAGSGLLTAARLRLWLLLGAELTLAAPDTAVASTQSSPNPVWVSKRVSRCIWVSKTVLSPRTPGAGLRRALLAEPVNQKIGLGSDEVITVWKIALQLGLV